MSAPLTLFFVSYIIKYLI